MFVLTSTPRIVIKPQVLIFSVVPRSINYRRRMSCEFRNANNTFSVVFCDYVHTHHLTQRLHLVLTLGRIMRCEDKVRWWLYEIRPCYLNKGIEVVGCRWHKSLAVLAVTLFSILHMYKNPTHHVTRESAVYLIKNTVFDAQTFLSGKYIKLV